MFAKRIFFFVRREDIWQGVRKDSCNCAAARAVSRRTGRKAAVAAGGACSLSGDPYETFWFPHWFYLWILRFDRGKWVWPTFAWMKKVGP